MDEHGPGAECPACAYTSRVRSARCVSVRVACVLQTSGVGVGVMGVGEGDTKRREAEGEMGGGRRERWGKGEGREEETCELTLIE
jgi:hypothetical protein